MKTRYWLTFFISVLICLFLSFFFGFSLTRQESAQLEKSLLKKTVKLNSFSYLEQLNQKLKFLTNEVQQIQSQENILLDSPFFALVVTHKSKKEQDVYFIEHQLGELLFKTQNDETQNNKTQNNETQNDNNKNDKTQNDRKKIQTEEKKQNSLKLKNNLDVSNNLALEKSKILIELSQKASSQVGRRGFYFQNLKTAKQNQALVLFVKPLGKDRQGVAFLKENKKFFKLPSTASSKNKNQEIFVIDRQGRIFFHTEPSQIFKTLSKKSPVWKSFEDLLKNPSRKSKYLTPTRKAEDKSFYYLHKWDKTKMVFVNETDFLLNLFSYKDFYFFILGFCLFFFFLAFTFFCFRFFSFVSAYNFLKRAFLSFDKTGLFPTSDSPKNSLLYFYNNRQVFLNKRNKENQNEKRESKSLSFQEIIKQELEKLKSKYPRLLVEEKFDFDVKVFSFDRFLRTIVYELLLNALEAMGGSKELKLLLSVQKEEEDLIFSVRDYGIGVQKEYYEKLFQLYYSTKSRTGVGLNLVQSIVKSNEGEIELSSPEGGGLQVRIRLPLKCFLKNFF